MQIAKRVRDLVLSDKGYYSLQASLLFVMFASPQALSATERLTSMGGIFGVAFNSVLYGAVVLYLMQR